MKAVIMAGGEGTRLRPLTSNPPKPMLPLVNRPMMEHIVDLLKRHGFDEIVVTVAFLANADPRPTSATAPSSACAWSTPPRRRRSAPPARCATPMDELDERFLVISGDVLTDIDLVDDRRASTTSARPMATIGLAAVENPLEFGIVITRDDGSIERFLEKPTWGQVFSDTINTGIFVLEPEIFDYIPPDRLGRLLQRGVPAAARRRASRSSARSPRATGRTSARSRPTSGPQGRARRQGRRSTSPASSSPTACGWARAPRSTPTPSSRARRVIGDNCRVEAGARIGEYTVLGANVPVRSDADLERTVVHDNAYLGESGARCGARSSAGRATSARASAARRASVLGDECFVGENAVLGPGVKVYPFKTVEAGAVVNSSIVWESRGARACSAATASPASPTSTSPPSWPCSVAMAYGTTLRRARRSSPRATPAGRPACSSGR